jgi:ABC-type uncharacterized transport system permease subunit
MTRKPGKPLTGRARRRTTTRRVKIAEFLSRVFITAGGYMTIVAVVGIMVFLLSVVLPLFGGVDVEEPIVQADLTGASVAAFGMDDDQLVSWLVHTDGLLRMVRLDDGAELDRRALFEGETPTSVEPTTEDGQLAFGFADGSVQLVELGVRVAVLYPEDVPPEAADLAEGAVATYRDGLLQRTPAGQVRLLRLMSDPQPRVRSDHEAAVVLAAHRSVGQSSGSGRALLAVLRADDSLVLSSVRTKKHILTGELRTTSRETELPYSPRPGHGPPSTRATSTRRSWPRRSR